MSDSPEEQTSRKLQAKRARREAEERKAAEQKRAARRRSLITTVMAVSVGVLVVALIVSQRADRPGTGGSIGGPPMEDAQCTPDEEHGIQSREHVPDGTQVEYDTDPPTSGDHWPPGSQADPGFYASPVDEERLVHNLEHGQIVIWYKTSAPEDVKDKMEQVAGQDPFALIAVPYDFEGPGQYAMTAWGFSQSCEIPSQDAIETFRKAHQGRGPEPVTPTYDG